MKKPPMQKFIEELSDVKFKVADSPNDLEDCEYAVCADADVKTHFTDNVFDVCSKCDCKVQHRPYVPRGLKLICYRCAVKEMKGEEVTALVTPQTQYEMQSWVRKKHGDN